MKFPIVKHLILTAIFFTGILAWGQSNPLISNIILKGHKKIEAAAIRNKLLSKKGEVYKKENVIEDVKALFKMGYFYDIIVEKEKSGKNEVALVYTLVEKPTIVSIEYEGNEDIDTEELEEIANVKAYQILDNSVLQSAVEKIEKLYEDKGFFLARVNVEVVDVQKNETVAVKFNIQENDKVVVKNIKFLGNSRLDSDKLKTVMQTKEGGFFSFVSGSGAYKQDAFDRDMQILNFLYFNEGFVQVKIDRPYVYITPDKKGIFITINITEGEQFNIGTVDFSGDLLFDEDELLADISVKSGELFSYEKMQRDIATLTAKYGDLGYAYANPIPRTRVKEKERIVDLTFEIDKGNKVYLGRINVQGNTKTRDKVVRRELRIYEGELYNETRKRESIDNVKRLGYFDEVNFQTKTPAGKPDIMDIDIVVKERNTGSIQVGAGYSSFDGFVLNGQVNQINLLGRGQKLGASIDWSDSRRNITINFTEPYFLDTEWEVGFDAYHRDRELLEYKENKEGGAFRVGHPLAPYLQGVIGYKIDNTNLELQPNGDPDLFDVDTANGITSSVTMSLLYDKRNDRFAPTQGLFSRLYVEYAGIGGGLDYTKGGANFRYYKNVFWDVVWRNNLNYSFVSSNDSNKDVPFNTRYLLGGANTLRGYDWFSIGKKKFSNIAFASAVKNNRGDLAEYDAMRPYGGRQELYYNLEFQFPLIKEAGILGVMFYDIGYADDAFRISDFKSDVGFGFRWFSPIGPLRFEWGFALNPETKFGEDSDGQFMFSIGSPF
ncbi:MAG: outer membrane protein assembly factor BamA [Bdellovibrionales bacterium]|nr:outer membrane protein assembly factor BamA [Bdellovibrionales bacterium]